MHTSVIVFTNTFQRTPIGKVGEQQVYMKLNKINYTWNISQLLLKLFDFRLRHNRITKYVCTTALLDALNTNNTDSHSQFYCCHCCFFICLKLLFPVLCFLMLMLFLLFVCSVFVFWHLCLSACLFAAVFIAEIISHYFGSYLCGCVCVCLWLYVSLSNLNFFVSAGESGKNLKGTWISKLED